MFDPVEEPLHPIASAVEVRVEADRIAAIAFRQGAYSVELEGEPLKPPGSVLLTEHIATVRQRSRDRKTVVANGEGHFVRRLDPRDRKD